ncbi:MAG: hypothetical protein HKN47_08950 [Pirellulaceae bacterium]|nr:hypothetical protein [Pirellulaceae bacterium]
MKIKLCATPLRAAMLIGGILFAGVLLATTAHAEEGNGKRLYLVQEDWEMTINDPDVATHSPQITFFACPNATNEDCYFQLQMNYHAHDEFSGGGFHVAAFRDDTQIDEARSDTRLPLRVDGDHIRWTNVIAANNDKLFFAVNDGHGNDWGNFGGPDYLVSMPANGVNDLTNYRHQKSLEMVDVGFGANRVSWIKLIRVRYYFTDGTSVKVELHQTAL